MALLSSSEVREMDAAKLKEFLALQIPEGPNLDYKLKLSGDTNKEAYKEFLKDVTAFANSSGGLIIIGIKEPSKGIKLESQIVGVDDANNLSGQLERVTADCVDPRIPGVIIRAISVDDNKVVIIVSVPPSTSSPHMVIREGHRCFYIRHSESVKPMCANEIRDAVLASATSESFAKTFLEREELDAREYFIDQKPSFFFQAMPLIQLESHWDVFSKEISNVIRGENRNINGKYKYDQFNLASSLSPTPTINGIREIFDRKNNIWSADIYRTGYFQVIYHVEPDLYYHVGSDPGKSSYILHDGYFDLFKAFLDLCLEAWNITKIDLPYVFKCKFINANGVIFLKNETYRSFTEPCFRRDLVWTEQVRRVGESLDRIHYAWAEQLYNAFGLNYKPKL